MGFDPSSATPVGGTAPAPAQDPSSLTPEDYFGVVKGLYPNAVFNGGGRTPQRNAAVGGVPDSMHLTNQAVDFNVPGVDHATVLASLKAAGLPMTEGFAEGQVGNQGGHIHVGWAPTKPPMAGTVAPASAVPAAAPSPAPAFDPTSAKPVAQPQAASSSGFDPTSARPVASPNFVQQGIMDLSNSPVIKGLVGAYQESVTGGLLMQPVRAAMEGLGYGMDQLKTAHPGMSDAWYQSTLHGMYNQAVNQARVNAQTQTQQNPYPGHQVGNFVAGVAGAPENLLMGGAGVGRSVAMRLATAGGANAIINTASDAAAQGMDLLEGQKKKFDVNESLRAAQTGAVLGTALHGVAEAAPHVAGLFQNRGVDTTPAADPRSSPISPLTTDHVQLNAVDAMQYKQLLATGDVDDIKNFFKGRNGPQPSYQDVNTWVQHRDNATGPVQPSLQPNFDYQSAYDEHAVNQQNETQRQAVEDHIAQQTQGWKNAPQFEVVHGPEDIQDPDIRAAAQKEDPNGEGLGFYGSDGKVRLFSGRITDPDVASAVVFHEGLGHFGMSEQFGDKLDSTLNTLMDRNVGQFAKRVDDWQKANPGAYGGDRTRAAEEVLAEDSQNGQIKSSWQDAVTASVRQFGRKMGLNLEYSPAEVRQVLAMSHDAVINGKGTDVQANGFKGSDPQQNKFMFTGPKATEFDPHSATVMQGSDGHIRNEIDDGNAKLTGANMGTLGGTLDHPELYKQYPHLKDLPVSHIDMSESGMLGSYSPKTKRMYIDPSRPDAERLSTILHETQHAIQHHEGYPGVEGGTMHLSPEDYENSVLEKEARATEKRKDLGIDDREAVPARFMRKNALGQEETDPALLDHIDQMKQDPRFWSDPEFRANAIEAARVRAGPGEVGPARTSFDKYMKASQYTPKQAMTRDDEYTNTLDETAKAYESHVPRGPVSWEETQRAALDLGFKPSQIKDLGDIDGLSVKIARIGGALNMAKARISTLNERLDTPNWTMDDKAQYVKTVADYNLIMDKYLGHGSEAGRALNVIKNVGFTREILGNINDLLKEHGENLASLANDETFQKFARALKEQMDAGNDAAARVVMRAVTKPYWEQYLTTLWHNSMLSSLATHFKSSVDMVNGIGLDAQERILAWPIDKIRSVFGKSADMTVQEAGAYSYGAMRSLGNMEMYRATLHAAATGEGSFVTPGGEKIPTNQNSFGTIQNPRFKGVASLINKPTDLISAQDTFFRSNAMAGHIYDRAMQMATEELGPKASGADRAALAAQYAHEPTPTMIKEAKGKTDRTLLMNNNPLNTLIDKGRVYKPNMTINERMGTFALNTITPFIRVESNNLWSRFVMRSPLGFLDKMTREQIRAGMVTGASRDAIQTANVAIARMAYGTMKMALYWNAAAAAKNLLTTNGPNSPDKFKEKEAGGWSPDSVHEDGRYSESDGLNTSFNPFDLHNNTASMVASMREAYEKGANENQVGIGLKLAAGSIAHDLVSQSWVNDMGPTVEAAMSTDGTASQKFARVATSEATNFYPNILTQTAHLMDPNRHDTTATDALGNADIIGTIKNTLESRVPGMTNGVPIKYSVYGEPLQNGASLTGVRTVGDFVGIHGNNTKDVTDPAEQELQRLGSLVSAAVITPVQKTIHVDGNPDPIKLTASQFEDYQRLAGKAIVMKTQEAMNDPSWGQMSDRDKIVAVRQIQTDMKKAARESLYGQQQ